MDSEIVNLDVFEAVAEQNHSKATRRLYEGRLKRVRKVMQEDKIENIPPNKLLKFIEKQSKHANGKAKLGLVPLIVALSSVCV